MARRTTESGYSFSKMLAKYFVRFKSTYGDEVQAWILAAQALGARDAKYGNYRSARLAATAVAWSAGLGGPMVGQVQAAIMNILKETKGKVADREALCSYVRNYVVAKNLDKLGYSDGKTAADAVLEYFGCGREARAPVAPGPASETPTPTVPLG